MEYFGPAAIADIGAAPSIPSLAPRTSCVKLLFKENPTINMKLRWLSEVSKTFRLDRELAEVKMSVVTSRFVYISRLRQDIIDCVTSGEILSLFLDVQDSSKGPESSRPTSSPATCKR